MNKNSLLVCIALLLVVGRGVAGAIAEYRWYAAIGAADVWRLRFTSAFLLRLLAFTVGTAAAFANLWAVRHSVVSLVLPRRLGNIEIGEEVSGPLPCFRGGRTPVLRHGWPGASP